MHHMNTIRSKPVTAVLLLVLASIVLARVRRLLGQLFQQLNHEHERGVDEPDQRLGDEPDQGHSAAAQRGPLLGAARMPSEERHHARQTHSRPEPARRWRTARKWRRAETARGRDARAV